MDVRASLEANCDPSRLFDLVNDLASYPQWMDLVHRVEPLGGDAWNVELRAKVGPFARSKRLRMVRTLSEPNSRVRFERVEEDGRSHAEWVLTATIDSDGSSCTLTMHLHYGGSLFTGGVLERVLADKIEAGRSRLAALVSN
jgi:ribosome-associated toxin RatA of RatAB toxin-antitoxin module